MESQRPNFGRVEKIRIPDSGVPGWIEALRQPDSQGKSLSAEEIDQFLGRMNKTYGELKGIINVDDELEKTENYLWETYGIILGEEQRQYLRAGIEQRQKTNHDGS